MKYCIVLLITYLLLSVVGVYSQEELEHLRVSPHRSTTKITLANGKTKTIVVKPVKYRPKDPDYMKKYYETKAVLMSPKETKPPQGVDRVHP